MPAVCVSRSRIVIARFAGTALTSVPATAPAGGGTATVVFPNAGMYLDTGSLRPSRPSSTSIIAATLVSAFDCEAMRKIVSFVIARAASTSDLPKASWWTTRPFRATSVTRPASLPSST